ncbi:hypothetical protein NDU88_000552 [Pleurodeles waltl]|uniref:Uncharacterized protein n=1 Tax=Pleurodeles waltl TaxID=8319 RepID=A0AAV7P162_PLEWA|nr:hypothetical protein NDU88_000552 [Pleurodeles waltl]
MTARTFRAAPPADSSQQRLCSLRSRRQGQDEPGTVYDAPPLLQRFAQSPSLEPRVTATLSGRDTTPSFVFVALLLGPQLLRVTPSPVPCTPHHPTEASRADSRLSSSS